MSEGEPGARRGDLHCLKFTIDFNSYFLIVIHI
jgi:hypothetical protein